MRRPTVVLAAPGLAAFFLAGCGYSPLDYAITVNEPMTWRTAPDRSLIELRYIHDPRYHVTVCSKGLLDRLETLDKREIMVEHRVWGAWPWSAKLHGFNPERVEGIPVSWCDYPGQISGFRGEQRPGNNPRHPLERHLHSR